MFSQETNFVKELNTLGGYCSRQYFSFPRCKDPQICNKVHVHRVYYPCVHYYLGNCKYGFNCKFSHVMSSKVPTNSENSICFFSLMGGCFNSTQQKKCQKRHSNDIKELQKYIKFQR